MRYTYRMRDTIPQEKGTPDVLDLCCGGKRCPILRDEGDTILATDPDNGTSSVRFAKTDLPRIIAWLESRAD